jgi:hypothetical protein
MVMFKVYMYFLVLATACPCPFGEGKALGLNLRGQMITFQISTSILNFIS